MNFRSLRSDVEWQHRDNPSLALKLDDALRAVADALGILAAAGHPFHLAFGHQPHVEFPRWMYHFHEGRRLVRSEWELRELGFGWYASHRDAQYAEGRDVQFAGRGGIRRRSLPRLVPGASAEFVPVGPTVSERKAEFLSARVDCGPILSDSKVE